MGGEQSTRRGPPPPKKTCYYVLLGVERTATSTEIKKAYRAKALELHPDRNYDDVENATRLFAEVQSAYETLSDPQEREWYDHHREQILRGEQQGGDSDDGDGGDGNARYYNDVRLTPAQELHALVARLGRHDLVFNDTPGGFFGLLESTFAQLALEEEAAAEGRPFAGLAPFGGADDDFETVVRPFYRDWADFSTGKSFAWKEKYRAPPGTDRPTRRAMMDMNKKARDAGVRDFNDAVRALVAFAKKRDPRCLAHAQTDAQRQQAARDTAAAQAKRQRAANAAKIRAQQAAQAAQAAQPAWAVPEPSGYASSSDGDFYARRDGDVDEGEGAGEVEAPVIECVVCDKTFKSAAQYEAHEKSKKHVKAVLLLKRQMRKEDKTFSVDDDDLLPPREDGGQRRKKGRAAAKAKAVVENKPKEVVEKEAAEAAEAAEKEAAEVDEKPEMAPFPERLPRPAKVSKSKAKAAAPSDDDDVDDVVDDDDDDDDDSDNEFAARMHKLSLKKQKKQKKQRKQAGFVDVDVDEVTREVVETREVEETESKAGSDREAPEAPKAGKAKARREKRAAAQAAAALAAGENDGAVQCTLCRHTFSSNTKLHAHLRADHATPGKRGRK